MSYPFKNHIIFKSLSHAFYLSIIEISIFLSIYTTIDWIYLDKDIIHALNNSISMIFHKLTSNFIIVQITLLSIWYYYKQTQITMEKPTIHYGCLFTILISSFIIGFTIESIKREEPFIFTDSIIALFSFGLFENNTPYFPIFITSSFFTIFIIKIFKLESN
ncbi:hypothetical protein WH96_16790 [Kiloniella spongiae]|uniref:Uncharacterized protein n=1 Tax=Kiloniella spongiae TaxID=1489064 RepID=A0A0H2MB43_9PROT|nr:hypothetical protein WH96_16790 [Kiloniella spongiae]